MAETSVAATLPYTADDLAASLASLLGPSIAPVVVAVSGGPDSIALMHLLATLDRPLTVATVDHGLRAASRDDADFVVAQAQRIGLAAQILTWVGPKPTQAVQGKAREARYRLLTSFCRETGATSLLTAHTLDDQAETLLFRMTRGTGVSGLAGMSGHSFRDGVSHLRPLLRVPKARLVAACAINGWDYRRDPSNEDPRFARTRMRQMLPALAAEGLDASRFGLLAERAARAETALRQAAERLRLLAELPAAPGLLRFDMGLLDREPEEFTIRVLGEAATTVGGSSMLRLDRLEHLAAEIRLAFRAGSTLRRSLGGATLTLARSGRLTIEVEAPRRRGRAVRETPVDPDSTQTEPFAAEARPFPWQ
ncbi:tRNA lysidine(34) synthetase TilS [Lichenihabitans psoromatis]|uniref:tRNA lysidine(34) synthetase TilS n=1 Tax=Lichenihabitans psoromatis TaxID=2528642 RepID=UPI00103838C3|nr:tRNA lysidine(34) synthetase TilS [Lichenihabitans psoromatis]